MKANNNYPLIKPIPERGLKAGRRILRKNSLPATHFVEIYTVGLTTNQQNDEVIILPISELENELVYSNSVCVSIKTIAIFKIRLK